MSPSEYFYCFLEYGFGGASVLETFTHCCSGLFKVNVHFVQVFSFFCSLLFSNEYRAGLLNRLKALLRAFPRRLR